MELNAAQESVLDLLRDIDTERPVFDHKLRFELQNEIDIALADIELPDGETQLRVNKWALNKVFKCEGHFIAPEDAFRWNPRNARGTIAHIAFELATGGKKRVTPHALVEAAFESVCSRNETMSLAEYLHECSDSERAELRVGVIDLVVKYVEMFPTLPEHWMPQAEATTAASFNRKVVLHGKIDLKLGTPRGNRSGSIILDFKTGAPTMSDTDDLRFYALIETLRTGTPPFKWASIYLDAGRIDEETVSEAVLWSAAKRVIDGAQKIAELRGGRAPVLNPGPVCRFCSLNETCDAALA